jgi:hypothetical protein
LDNNPTDSYLNQFEKEKITYSEIVREPQFHFDTEKYYIEATSFIMTGEYLKYLIVLLNSKPITYFFKTFYTGGGLGTNGYRYKKAYLEKLPIPKLPENEQIPFIEKADKMIELNKKFINKKNKFLNRLKGIGVNKISKKLENFYTLDFNELIKELKKQKIKLPLKEQDEWEDYFNDYRNELNEILSEIEKTDKEIDKMVYKLYNLTDEEINIIENIN